MKSSENVKVIITDISGINLAGLNVYNMALCTQNFDGANKNYVTSRYPSFNNIGIGSNFYKTTVNTTVLFRSIATNILNSLPDPNKLYLSSNLFYIPYPRYGKDNTSIITNASSNSYLCSSLAPNGKIYFTPTSQNSFLVLDPNTKSIDTTSITVTNGLTTSWMSSVLAPNGKIYCIPGESTTVLILDPLYGVVDTTSVTIPGLSGGTIKWATSCITKNGIIYGIPYVESRILIIDTNTNVYDLTSFSVGGVSTNKFSCCCYTPQNKIFALPGNTTDNNPLIINLTSRTIDNTSVTLTAGQAYATMVIAPNGLLYSPPAIVPTVGNKWITIINPATNVVDTSNLIFENSINVNTSRYYGSVISPEGLLYCTPGAASNILIVDTNTNRIDSTNITVSGLPATAYGKSIIAPNGKIYCAPYNVSNMLVINTGIPRINMRQCFIDTNSGN